jgi:hypothetical protein
MSTTPEPWPGPARPGADCSGWASPGGMARPGIDPDRGRAWSRGAPRPAVGGASTCWAAGALALTNGAGIRPPTPRPPYTPYKRTAPDRRAWTAWWRRPGSARGGRCVGSLVLFCRVGPGRRDRRREGRADGNRDCRVTAAGPAGVGRRGHVPGWMVTWRQPIRGFTEVETVQVFWPEALQKRLLHMTCGDHVRTIARWDTPAHASVADSRTVVRWSWTVTAWSPGTVSIVFSPAPYKCFRSFDMVQYLHAAIVAACALSLHFRPARSEDV